MANDEACREKWLGRPRRRPRRKAGADLTWRPTAGFTEDTSDGFSRGKENRRDRSLLRGGGQDQREGAAKP